MTYSSINQFSDLCNFLRQDVLLIELITEVVLANNDIDVYIGLIKFLAGETPNSSRGICERMTYGYGELDECGYWQYPIPYPLIEIFEEWFRMMISCNTNNYVD